MTKSNPKVGFVFSTKDRLNFTLRSLASIDTDSGFDLMWVDGSDTSEGKALPQSVKLRNCRLVEVHYDIKGGPDNAIRFGLRRLLDLGYDYCGLIENDIELKPDWFPKLMELFKLGRRDGLSVGAATVGTIGSRILIRRPKYLIMWNMGARMVLFTRQAARIVLATYRPVNAQTLHKFYMDKFGIDLGDIWELWMDKTDRELGCDWAYAMQMYDYGFSSLGSIISLASNIDFDFETTFRALYVRELVKVSKEDIKRFSQFVSTMSQGGVVFTIKQNLMLIRESVRSATFWAERQNKHARRILHAVRSVKHAYIKIYRFIFDHLIQSYSRNKGVKP